MNDGDTLSSEVPRKMQSLAFRDSEEKQKQPSDPSYLGYARNMVIFLETLLFPTGPWSPVAGQTQDRLSILSPEAVGPIQTLLELKTRKFYSRRLIYRLIPLLFSTHLFLYAPKHLQRGCAGRTTSK